jgi:hypothetical protein
MSNLRHHLLTIFVYNLNESRFITFYAFCLILVLFVEKYAVIFACINLLILQTESKHHFLTGTYLLTSYDY